MRCFLVESLDENIRDLSRTPSSSENSLAYCLQAIAEIEEKVEIMKSQIAKMEEEINRVPILRNELLANDPKLNNDDTDNFPPNNPISISVPKVPSTNT
jgi:chromosome segregation ATPase